MNELKLLHAADLHLGSGFRGLPPQKRDPRRRIHKEIPQLLTRLCREENCQMVLLAGDVFHDREPETALVESLLKALGEMEVPVVIAPGNHDPLPLWRQLEQQGLPRNVHVFLHPRITDLSFPELDVRVWGGAFPNMDCPGLLEGFRCRGQETWQLGLLHGDPINPGSTQCPVTRLQAENSGLDYLALGHIHKAGRYSAGKTLCAWPGCPMGTGFDETGSKGVFLVELKQGQSPRLEFRDLGLGRYETLELPAGDHWEKGIAGVLPADTSQDVYRLTLTGTAEKPDLRKLEEALSPRFYHLILEDRTTAPTKLWDNVDTDSLEGLYMTLLKQALDTAAPEERETVLLAAKISRRLLEGQEVELP